MDDLKYPGNACGEAGAADYNGPVGSPEFSKGCADARVGAPPSVPTGAPIPAVAPRPQPAPDGTGADDLPPAPVSTLHAKDEPAEGFPEIACSPEFPAGCVDPSEEDAAP
jgi:hypothetical protein